jgi:DHA1 family bicyclomycin/chloramphenicol resistance-like MFS transporter
MTSRFLRNAVVLGLISAIGPFAIDMYLPALPTIADNLHASTAATQMTLMAFFIAFGVCQIVYGPLSDMVGRKAPLYFGLIVYVLGAAGCALAPSIGWLIAFRALQGVGASAVMVIPRAIIRDLHTGVEGARLMALVMLVLSVSPILAPVTGSALIVPFGWRAVFIAVAVVATIAIGLVATTLPETLTPAKRVRIDRASLAAGFATLFGDPRFLGLTFIGGLGMASFFTFLASASFVYIDHFGLGPTAFSIAFSLNAIGFIGSSQFAAWLGGRYGLGRLVRVSVASYAAVLAVLLALTVAGVDSLAVLMAFLLVGFSFMGLVIPTTMVMALDEHGTIAGMAAALGGTLQMVTGAVMIVIASLIFNGTPLPMIALMTALAWGALALAILTLRRRTDSEAPEDGAEPAVVEVEAAE